MKLFSESNQSTQEEKEKLQLFGGIGSTPRAWIGESDNATEFVPTA